MSKWQFSVVLWTNYVSFIIVISYFYIFFLRLETKKKRCNYHSMVQYYQRNVNKFSSNVSFDSLRILICIAAREYIIASSFLNWIRIKYPNPFGSYYWTGSDHFLRHISSRWIQTEISFISILLNSITLYYYHIGERNEEKKIVVSRFFLLVINKY
jgi:hypothetical protein